ncbi:Peptidase S24/S26A/S26B, conserved region [Solidesulfovibrio fructosivorans JJ]]|uniref:Peptidase S24/S26A/S26B, conserved region n=1 Tax=Solidesulfovibrio fructosivorans JJ] TaxID=596151 RepID=E1JQZ2_SOLFR|nr:translesion error-prone DNA polymerase V autoproteolytic subunit [Solidesulfovibrio fructosivorans]EFL52993.1 Peptidase S24/S26A/S26B, conserved region [Solidesulfovibrio fructosivorans JJ]]
MRPQLPPIPLEARTSQPLPFYLTPVSAGFPSPAEDYLDQALDLNDLCIAHPAATFYVRASGESMRGAGIQSGDILVVDRAEEARPGRIVIAAVDGELTVKRLKHMDGRLFLAPENDAYKPIEIRPESSFEIWGVVTFVIHRT